MSEKYDDQCTGAENVLCLECLGIVKVRCGCSDVRMCKCIRPRTWSAVLPIIEHEGSMDCPLLARRIACDGCGYPATAALYTSVKDYYRARRNQRRTK